MLCYVILTLNLPKNQQKSFFGNSSLILMHFLLKIKEQILSTMVGITDLFKKLFCYVNHGEKNLISNFEKKMHKNKRVITKKRFLLIFW